MKRLALAITLVLASGAEARDFLDTYTLARDNDAQLAAAGATLEARRETKPIARSGLLPQIALSGSATRYNRDLKGIDAGIGTQNFNTTNWGVNLSQPLYRRDRWYEYKQSEDVVQQAESEYRTAEQGLVLRVAQAYFNVLSAQATMKAADAQLRALERQLDQAQQRYDVGLIAITDVLEVKSVRDGAISEQIRAKQQFDDANDALREIIATDPGALADVSRKMPLDPPQPNSVEAWETLAFDNNPALQAAREVVEVSQKEVEVQKSGHYPSVDLVGGYNDTTSGAIGASEPRDTSVGVQLSLPIYTGGRVTATTRQARHNLTAAEYDLESTRRGLERQVGDAYRGVISSISDVQALNAAKVSTKSAWDATEAGYEVGTRTIVDVLLTQRNFFEADRDYAIARYRYILNLLLLEDAVGTLDEDDVRRVNGWLIDS
jgi:outer membrane protein